MILGLTGKNASGKGTVAEVLKTGGFEYFSLSDEIRRSLEQQGIPITRDTLTEEGNRIRRQEGAGALATRVVGRFSHGVNQVVDSIRNPHEVAVLRCQQNFFLVAVDAPCEIRFERLRQRARPGDPDTLEGFLAAEERELQSGDPITQQLLATIELADYTINNTDGKDAVVAAVRNVFRDAAGRTTRPTWDEYFMAIARVISSRGNCAKRRVAAVVVKDSRIVSTGYNGTPRGTSNCNSGGCPRCLSLTPSGEALGECVCSHAEENAITQAAYHGVSLKGATIYSTFMPCIMCTKMIINAGISEVVFHSDYPLPPEAASLFRQAGVSTRQFRG